MKRLTYCRIGMRPVDEHQVAAHDEQIKAGGSERLEGEL
jgi:hypothetical protein